MSACWVVVFLAAYVVFNMQEPLHRLAWQGEREEKER